MSRRTGWQQTFVDIAKIDAKANLAQARYDQASSWLILPILGFFGFLIIVGAMKGKKTPPPNQEAA